MIVQPMVFDAQKDEAQHHQIRLMIHISPPTLILGEQDCQQNGRPEVPPNAK